MKLSLSKINFFNIIGIVIVFSTILSAFIYAFTDTFYQHKIAELEKSYYNKNKALVQNEVVRGVARVEIIKNIIYKNNESTLKENKRILDKRIEKIIFSEFKKDKFGDTNYGYFWILGLDKIMKMHPKIEGKNIEYMKTLDGRVLADVIIKKALNNGGYVNYQWLNPYTNKVSDKTSYIKLIPDLNLIIGAGFI